MAKDPCESHVETVRRVAQVRLASKSKLPRECQIKIDGSVTSNDTIAHGDTCEDARESHGADNGCVNALTRTGRIYTVTKQSCVRVGLLHSQRGSANACGEREMA